MHRSTFMRPLFKLFGAVLAVLLAIAGVTTAAPAQAGKPWRTAITHG